MHGQAEQKDPDNLSDFIVDPTIHAYSYSLKRVEEDPNAIHILSDIRTDVTNQRVILVPLEYNISMMGPKLTMKRQHELYTNSIANTMFIDNTRLYQRPGQ